MYTANEVAKILKVSKSTVWRLIASGQLGSCKIGRARRVPGEALAEFIDKNTKYGD